jgi:hypothetical protein
MACIANVDVGLWAILVFMDCGLRAKLITPGSSPRHISLPEPLPPKGVEHSTLKEHDSGDHHSCEDEQSVSPTVELDPCPSGPQNAALNSTSIMYNTFLENSCAMDVP